MKDLVKPLNIWPQWVGLVKSSYVQGWLVILFDYILDRYWISNKPLLKQMLEVLWTIPSRGMKHKRPNALCVRTQDNPHELWYAIHFVAEIRLNKLTLEIYLTFIHQESGRPEWMFVMDCIDIAVLKMIMESRMACLIVMRRAFTCTFWYVKIFLNNVWTGTNKCFVFVSSSLGSIYLTVSTLTKRRILQENRILLSRNGRSDLYIREQLLLCVWGFYTDVIRIPMARSPSQRYVNFLPEVNFWRKYGAPITRNISQTVAISKMLLISDISSNIVINDRTVRKPRSWCKLYQIYTKYSNNILQ